MHDDDKDLSPNASRRTKVWGVLVEYCELVLAIGAAVAICALGIVGALAGEALATATLGVLAALAASTIRERFERLRSTDATRKLTAEARADTIAALEDLRELARVAASDKPWQVIDEATTWDLRTATEAKVTSERKIRFLQAQTAAVWERSRSSASAAVVGHLCRGGPLGGPLRSWPVPEDGFLEGDSRLFPRHLHRPGLSSRRSRGMG